MRIRVYIYVSSLTTACNGSNWICRWKQKRKVEERVFFCALVRVDVAMLSDGKADGWRECTLYSAGTVGCADIELAAV